MTKIKKFYFKLNLNMLLFCLGVIVGTTAINFFYGYYGNTSSDLINTYFGSVSTYSSFGEVFFGVFIRRVLLAALIIAVFELFNNIFTVYMLLSTLGAFCGIVMTVLSMNLGIKSIWSFVLICFPHVFIYTLSVYILIRLKFGGYYTAKFNDSYISSYLNSNFDKRKGYFIVAIIFVIGVFAETFNALYILPRVFSTFM